VVCTRTTPPPTQSDFRHDTDYRNVCAADDVDCVVVATPPDSHYEICKAALLAGKHVICEKPFVFHAAQAEELSTLAREKRLNLIINYIHLFNPAFIRLREAYDPTDTSVKYVESEGLAWGPFREDYSVAWDWMSHDVAMLFSVFGSDFNISTICQQDPSNPYKTTLSAGLLGANQIRASVHCGNTSFHKRRRFSIKSEHQSLEFVDDGTSNPLRLMLEEFVTKTTAGILHSNTGLAQTVTQFLELI
jgi:predicted dehydrogenase